MTKRNSVKDLAQLLKGHDADESQFDKAEFAKGMLVEMEHSNRRELQAAIVKAHLLEDPFYYSKLESAGIK